MLAAVLGDLIHGRRQHGPIHGTVFVLVASLGVAAWLWTSDGTLPGSATQAYLGQGPLADSAADELAAAARLSTTDLAKGRRNLVAGWPGFAVVLFAERTGEISVVRTEELPAHVDTLWAGSTLVLLVGEEEDGFAPALVEVGRALDPKLALTELWQAGPWTCFRVERAETGTE